MFLLIILGFIIAGVLTLYAFRYATQSLGAKELVTEGIELREDGIQIPRLLWLGKQVISYRDVESVELFPWYQVALQFPLLRYGIGVRSVSTRPFHDTLAIRLRGPDVSETILVTPKEPRDFAEELKRRVEESKSSDTK